MRGTEAMPRVARAGVTANGRDDHASFSILSTRTARPRHLIARVASSYGAPFPLRARSPLTGARKRLARRRVPTLNGLLALCTWEYNEVVVATRV